MAKTLLTTVCNFRVNDVLCVRLLVLTLVSILQARLSSKCEATVAPTLGSTLFPRRVLCTCRVINLATATRPPPSTVVIRGPCTFLVTTLIISVCRLKVLRAREITDLITQLIKRTFLTGLWKWVSVSLRLRKTTVRTKVLPETKRRQSALGSTV